MWTCPHCDGQTDDEFEVCWTCRIPRGQEWNYHQQSGVLVTATPDFSTFEIEEYVGLVFGETIYGANFLRDLAGAFVDFTGGRSKSYEEVIAKGRTAALHEMQKNAEKRGCNGVVSVDVKYEPVGESMFLICASGTAVRLRSLPPQSGDAPGAFVA